jgi:hypothetical protein
MKKEQLEKLIDIRNVVNALDGEVFFPGEIEAEIETHVETEKERKAREKKESFRPLSIFDYDEYELMDSIVPACCKYGCYVEPDGYCEHEHPSILLFNGLI